MKRNRIYFIMIILSLLLTACLISSVQSQLIQVTLSSPANSTTVSSYIVDFHYVPSPVGNTAITGAKLMLNGTATTATNQTTIQNNRDNIIAYAFNSNGTYLWNIQIQNSTASVTADSNNTLTVSVYVAPTPTPTPTATPTPTPTATPQAPNIDIWNILIIVLFVFAIAGAVALAFLRKRTP